MHCFGAKSARVLLKLLALLGLAIASPGLAQHTSTECPPQSATVSSGGTVTIDITDCASSIAFASLGTIDGGSYGPADFEDHGIATTRITGGRWFLDYSHNGTTGIGSTDVFEITEGDGNGDVRVTITINASASPIIVLPGTLPILRAGTAFSQTLTASGGLAPYAFSLQSGSLPPGLTLSSAGGLSGTPTQRGAFSFSVRVRDATSPTAQFVDRGYTGSVQNPVLSLAATSGTAIQGVSFSQTLAANGGVAPYVYQIETGSLPAGITLSSAGVLAGTTSAAAGNYLITIRVTDSSTGPGTYFEVENFTLTVSPPPAVSITVSPASVSEDGTTNLTYTVTRSFATPGTVTVNLTYSGTATSGTDYAGGSGTIVIPANATSATLTIDPVADTLAEPGETVTVTIAAGSGYSIGSPFSATGTITNDDGSSTYPGCATRNVSVANGGTVRVDLSTCHAFGLGVVSQPPSHGTATAGPGPINYYDYTHNGNNATSDRFVVLDDNGQTIVVNVSIAAPTSAIVVAPANLAPMTAGTAFSQTLGSTGGTGPYTYTPVAGTLPVGLSLSGTGVISGTPTQRGSYSFEVRSQDALGAFTVKGYTGTVAPASLTLTSGTGTAIQGVAFSQTLTTTNGVAPFTYQLETGSWPAGISLSGNGVLSGTTSAAPGSYPVTIRVTDSSTGIGTNFQLQSFTLTVSAPPTVSIAVSPASITEDGGVNLTYTVTRSANLASPTIVNISTAGTATTGTDYTGSVPTIAIPANATSATIVIDPAADDAFEPDETVILTIAAGSGYTVGSPASATGTISNDDVPVTVAPGALPDATAGQPYSQTLSASGGTAPYSFAVTSGALPPGLSLTGSGLLSGTPGAGGDFTFAITATDGSGAPGPFSGTQNYTLTVADAVVDLPSATLPGGTAGSPYSASIPAASGGTAPYSYAITAGQLPDGLTLNAGTGAISGTPTAAGSYLFDVTATDSSTGTGPFSATQSYAIEITDLPPVVNPVSLTVPYNSGPVNVPVSFSGGTPTSYGEVTSPANGTVITLGTVITYQPNPGYAGPDSFTYNASNSGGTSAPATVTITVSDPVITVSPSGSLAAAVGAPYSQTFTWAGGTAPFSGFQVTGLPLGLTITGSTANSVTISGTPTQAGSFSLNASASDSSTGNGSFTVGQAFTLTVAPPMLDLAPGAGVLTAAYGTPFSQSFTASGGIGGYSYSLTGALPPGLSLGGDTIAGTPTTPGSYNFSVTATDGGATGTGAPFSITQAYTIEVPSPVITLSPAALANGTAAAPYTQTLSASGGVAPLTFTLGGGTLPAGISLSAGGVLTGTPTEAGSFTFSVIASDANGQSGSRSYTLVIDGPALSLAPASGTLTLPYGGTLSQGFSASGGNGPYTYAISGSLPAGITFDPGNGFLSGSTFVVGDFAFTVTATDTGTSGAGGPFSVAQSYTLRVTPPTLAITPGSLPGATVGNSYASSLIASGGAAPYSFTVTGGALPAGLGLSPAGVISGTPSAGGSFTFTITASDSGPAPGPFTVSRAYTLDVAAPVVALPATSLPDGQRGSAYSATLNPATGGTAPYTYAVTGGALPAGLTLSSGGSLTGTPTVFGSFSFAVTATDSSTGTGPYTATQSYTLAIIADPPVAGAVSVTLPYGAPSTPIPLNLAGGPVSSVAVQSDPANGSASVSGTVLSYQPRAGFSGTDSLTYTASNDGGTSSPATITITVGAPSLSVTASGPLDAVVGAPYNQTFSFAGGSAPFRSPEVTGLPAGLALTGTTANSVTISGTPRSQGTFTLSVSATDSSIGNGPFTASQTFALNVAAPDLSLTPATGTFSAPYAAPFSQTFVASGGIGTYSFAVSGTLPAGLALDGATGILSGSPTQTGSFAFTITATDTGASGPGAPFTVTSSYTLNVAAPTITVAPTALPNARSGTAYSVSLTGSGAVAPYTFTITGGALPAGLALAPGGQIAGTPTASGNFPFEVTARDANGQTSQARLTLTVDVPTLTVTPATLPNAVQGVAYSQTLTVSGGIAPYRFSIGSGSLPAGLSLDPVRGIISGTPTGSGTANFAVTVTDSTGGTPASATVAYSLQITARPDPARDPEVRGLTQAQVLASRRFADTQVNNFMRRLESMHGNARSTGGFQNGVRLTSNNYCEDTVTSWTSDICRKTEAQPGLRARDGFTGEETALGAGTGSAAAERPWTVWTGGTIRFGERDPATGIERQDFESEGLSLGADYRFSPSFAAGLGIGFGRDTANVGENQSRSSAEATTIAVYGSHQLGSGIFLDWLGGYQWLDFDLRRYVTSTGALVNSNRSGNQWFVTGSAGADIATGNWQITPYARVDVRRGTLNGYTENSGSLFDLRFLDQDVDFTSLGLGTVVNYQHRLRRATLLPRLRIEYLYDVERSAEARVAYADLISGPFSVIPLTGVSREQLTLGLGTEVLLGEALSLELEYLGRIASGSGTDQSLQAGVSLKF